jgi:XTP/dITP diphosphohydrolase
VKRLVIASGNPGKLRELRAMLEPLGIEAIAQDALGIAEADEPHRTFLENALAKARHASRAARLPALADDSGLCVEALGGAPGVDSAYYAGRSGSREERDRRNNAKLVAALREVRERSAFYYCVLVLVAGADDPTPLVADARWTGAIALEPRGSGGFGYDPYFRLDDGRSVAELAPAEKNRASHRGQALADLARRLAANGAG